MKEEKIKCATCGLDLIKEQIEEEILCDTCREFVCGWDCLEKHGDVYECGECVSEARYADCARCGREFSLTYEKGEKWGDEYYCSAECARMCDDCGEMAKNPKELISYHFVEYEPKKYQRFGYDRIEYTDWLCEKCYSERRGF